MFGCCRETGQLDRLVLSWGAGHVHLGPARLGSPSGVSHED